MTSILEKSNLHKNHLKKFSVCKRKTTLIPGVHGWEQFQEGQEHQLKHSGVPAAPLSLQCPVGSTAVPTRGSTQLHTQQGATPCDGPTAQPGAKQGRGTCTRQTDERWSQRSAVSITTNTALYEKVSGVLLWHSFTEGFLHSSKAPNPTQPTCATSSTAERGPKHIHTSLCSESRLLPHQQRFLGAAGSLCTVSTTLHVLHGCQTHLLSHSNLVNLLNKI